MTCQALTGYIRPTQGQGHLGFMDRLARQLLDLMPPLNSQGQMSKVKTFLITFPAMVQMCGNFFTQRKFQQEIRDD